VPIAFVGGYRYLLQGHRISRKHVPLKKTLPNFVSLVEAWLLLGCQLFGLFPIEGFRRIAGFQNRQLINFFQGSHGVELPVLCLLIVLWD